MATPHTTADAQHDALAWLAGRLQWERVLRDLGDRAEHAGHPVELAAVVDDVAGPVEHTAAPAAAPARRAA